jgi:hypothetical protein
MGMSICYLYAELATAVHGAHRPRMSDCLEAIVTVSSFVELGQRHFAPDKFAAMRSPS